MPTKWVAALFAKLQARYGSKFTAQYDGLEDIAAQEWADVLGDLTGEQIRHGLTTWTDPWPPSVYEFRQACTGGGRKNEYGLDYIPEYHRPRERRATRLLSSQARDERRQAAQQHIEALRSTLRRTS